ncbi:unnamed protein product [Rhizopus stolonifer]
MQPTTKNYSHHPPEIIQPSYKAPDSFILFCKKRTHELKMRGQYITTNELLEEWKLLSNDQKEEFQNQSRCIQFTLDIDNRINNKKLNMSHISPCSMIIPNEEDHSTLKPLATQPALNLYSNNQNPHYSKAAVAAVAEAVALESLTSSTKQKVLPEKIKRPPNAYLLFNRDMRCKLKDSNKGLTAGEISKSISQKWKQLSKTEKDEYFKQEALLKHNTRTNVIYFRRSKAELKKAGLLKKTQKSCFKKNSKKNFYKKSSMNSEGIPDPRGRKKKANDMLPKHPMSAYLHFAKKMRPIIKESFPDATLVDVSKQIGSKWRSMTQSELCPWVELANQDKASTYGVST